MKCSTCGHDSADHKGPPPSMICSSYDPGCQMRAIIRKLDGSIMSGGCYCTRYRAGGHWKTAPPPEPVPADQIITITSA